MLDTRRLADTLVAGAKSYIDKSLSGLIKRLDALESRTTEKGDSGKDGRDGIDGKDGKDGVNGADGKDGIDGKDAPTPTQSDIIDAILSVPEFLDKAIAKYLSANPPVAGRDGLNGKDGADGMNGRDGNDGIGLSGAVQDIEGNLIITDTRGGTHNVGKVKGLNGSDGQNGKDGQRGSDGLSLKDFSAAVLDDGRTIVLKLQDAEREESVELTVPAMIYRGVFSADKGYEPGDVVTWGGSTWHCNASTSEKPETTKSWTLMVKRGRDGKDGTAGERGERGLEGKAGRDLTQLGLDGAKW